MILGTHLTLGYKNMTIDYQGHTIKWIKCRKEISLLNFVITISTNWCLILLVVEPWIKSFLNTKKIIQNLCIVLDKVEKCVLPWLRYFSKAEIPQSKAISCSICESIRLCWCGNVKNGLGKKQNYSRKKYSDKLSMKALMKNHNLSFAGPKWF